VIASSHHAVTYVSKFSHAIPIHYLTDSCHNNRYAKTNECSNYN